MIQRDLSVGNSVTLLGWHLTCSDIDLNGRKYQDRHLKTRVTRITHLYKLLLSDSVMDMNILSTLLTDRRLKSNRPYYAVHILSVI